MNDPSIIKNTAHVDLNDKNLDNVRFVKVNSLPAVRENQTISYWLDELSLLRLDPYEKLKLDEQDSIFRNSNLTSTKAIIEIPFENYIDSLHESCRNRRDLSLVFNDQQNEVDNKKLTDLDSVTVNRILI